MKIVLAGGSGALGRRIATELGDQTDHGHEIVVLTRSPDRDLPHRQVFWDGETVGPWSEELAGSAVINLAGAIVDRPPTAANIGLLTTSRVRPTNALARAAADLDDPPRIWLQMSTLAIYGDAGEAIIEEGSPIADGPPQMAGVARAWEEAASDAPAERSVVLRTAVVLDVGTPALDRLVGLTRWGLGGRVGSGRQWVSWLHIDDLLAIVRRVLEDDGVSGMLHACSLSPVRNHELMAALREVVHRPAAPPTPEILVRLGSRFLRTDPALALTGRRCVPRRLTELGFSFGHPDLRPALHHLLDRSD